MNTEKILTIFFWTLAIGLCLAVSMVLGGLNTMNETVDDYEPSSMRYDSQR